MTPKNSTSMKPFYLFIVIALPILIGLVGLILFFYEQSRWKYVYLLMLILFGYLLKVIKLYRIPKTISLNGNKLIMNSLFGKEITIDLNDIWSIEIKYGILIIKAGRLRIYTLNGYPGIKNFLEKIKQFTHNEKILQN